jgi:hypothetical protein
VSAFWANWIAQKNGFHIPWIHAYMDDLICIPVILFPLMFLFREDTKRFFSSPTTGRVNIKPIIFGSNSLKFKKKYLWPEHNNSNLISVYDKAGVENIRDKELKLLIKNFKEE